MRCQYQDSCASKVTKACRITISHLHLAQYNLVLAHKRKELVDIPAVFSDYLLPAGIAFAEAASNEWMSILSDELMVLEKHSGQFGCNERNVYKELTRRLPLEGPPLPRPTSPAPSETSPPAAAARSLSFSVLRERIKDETGRRSEQVLIGMWIAPDHRLTDAPLCATHRGGGSASTR